MFRTIFRALPAAALLLAVLAAASCKKTPEGDKAPNAVLFSCTIDGRKVASGGRVSGASTSNVVVDMEFSSAVDATKMDSEKIWFSNFGEFSVAQKDEYTITLTLAGPLKEYTSYNVFVLAGDYLGVHLIGDYSFGFVTGMEEKQVFPEIPTEDLLTLVQERTFAYFWDYAHPVSGLARERLNSGETVTTGGSGFGLMAIPVGIERGFITREEGAGRALKVVSFLQNKAVRYHGAFPHWLNGTTGETIAFSTYDNGADLVETAFLMEGLLTLRSYFSGSDATETAVRSGVTALWEAVEWDHFTRGGQNVLYWHWSPDYGWQMNMQIKGWNEALIVYVLAASSPTHSISKEVYDRGWAAGAANGRKFYDITLPLGPDYGGPMFFAHYSFLGLDPRNLSDAYANYWEQNTAHAKINYNYCVKNPRGYYGYGSRCWGLTASDYSAGYTASSPTNDTGTIAPTAALASMPYTPEESIAAMEYFYYYLGNRIWGDYGFHDAFSLEDRWFATSYIAIDQGPMICMIENYRTGLLWDTFMKNPDVCRGLEKLGFRY